MTTSNWQQRQLGDCLTLMSGGTPSKARNDFWGGDIPWVSCKDMKVDRIHDAEDHLTPLGAENGTRLVPENTILFVVRGMILAREFPVAMTMRTVAFNQDLKAVKPSEFIDNEFLFHWFRANTYEILGRADEAGHGTKRIQTDRLLSLPIKVPPIPVQRRIASVLSAYDDLLENNRRRMQILEEMARTLYREWFVEFRFPGHQTIKRVTSSIGPIPEGWKLSEMQEIAEVIDCLHSKKPAECTDGPGILLQLNNIGEAGKVDMREQFRICAEDYALWTSRIELQAGDCVITNVGRVAAIAQIPEGVCAAPGRNMTAVRPRVGKLTSSYLIEYLLSAHMAAEVSRKKDLGAIMESLNVKGIIRLLVPCPPMKTMLRFEGIVRPIRRRIEVLVEQIQDLRRTRDLLLPRLLSGEFTLNDADPRKAS